VRLPDSRAALLRTLEDLAAIGDKRVGTAGGQRAAAYLGARFNALGLPPRVDPFYFPRHEVLDASLDVIVGGALRPIGFEVLEGCGGGRMRADLTFAGWADDPLARAALGGQVALVDRHLLYHRSTQYRNVVDAGARALIQVSTAPGNLCQVGSVRRAWEASGAVPALSIGSSDGHLLKTALAAGQRVEAIVAVDVRVTRGVGQNVLAVVEGFEPAQLVIGAHYDSWFAGSTDNGGGVAALLALAERWARRPQPRYTMVFVAWDGEEVALYGGYHYLRHHVVLGQAPVLAVINFETPSAHGAQAYGLARSSQAALERAIVSVGLHDLFAANLTMDLVPELFGGVIPTDIQGLYRSGMPTVSTAVDSPYYHTVEDTPDKVDLQRLAETVDGFDRALARLMAEPPERLNVRDPSLWRCEVRARAGVSELLVDVVVRDHLGAPRPWATVEVVLFHDHFFETANATARTDEAGRATLTFPAELLVERSGPRFLHVTAGDRYPLVEEVVPID
jgi:hypothetical protein